MKALVKIILISLFSFPCYFISAQENSFLLGQAAFQKTDYQQAVRYLNEYLIAYPKDQRARILKAQSLLMTRNYQEANKDLADVKISNNPEILLLQSRSFAGQGDIKPAIDKLTQYLNTNNKIADEIIKAYPEFVSLKSLPEWLNLWSNTKYTDKETALNNIKYAINSEHFGEAADRLDNFLDKYKSNAEAYYLRGNLYSADGNFKNALDCYESAVNIDNSNSEYLIARAKTLHQAKRDKKALEEFNLLINNDSLLIFAYLGRAEAELTLSANQEAFNDISKFRKYYPDNLDGQFVEAKVNVKRGDFLSAIAGFGKLIKEKPSNPEYFVGRADAYAETKTYAYAIKDYSMALDLAPRNIEVYKKKAKAYQLSGDNKNACINWNYAARLGDVESLNFIARYCKHQ